MRPALAMVLALPLLGGCVTAPRSDVQVTDAPHDGCSVHRAAFRSSAPDSDQVTGQALAAAGLGVAVGVGVGLVTGNMRQGLVAGATVAGVGIAATLIQANFRQMQEEQRREALLRQAVSVNGFGFRVTGAQLAVERLTECRRQQAQTLRADVRAGRLPREEGQRRLQEIRGWLEDDARLVRAFDSELERDSKALADSSRHINGVGLEAETAFRPFGGIAAWQTKVKSAASDTANDVAELRPGQPLRVVARDGQWLRVTLPNGRAGFVRASAVAREAAGREFRGTSEQSIRTAAQDDAAEVGRVGGGSPYRVVGAMPGWLVVDQGQQKNFVRATALRPAEVDSSGRDVLQATVTAVAARDSFAQSANALEAEGRRMAIDL
ncbi:SH3 domain-containing protein [Falsiroseomonas stagni]|uniref:SH3 domain-containing protein n=1 Tax=Falsiroseomonas stagni TaxID=484882 RepID=UPI001C314706|nr:SH3 domain-containing protein [Falsiroseomonas stagni]